MSSVKVNVPLSKPPLMPNDNIYYNVEFVNKDITRPAVPIQFNEKSSYPIVEKPDQYKLAVTRFSLPGEFIPIMIWNPNSGALTGAPEQDWNARTNPGSKVKKFEVVMEFGGTVIRKYLEAPVNSTNTNYLYNSPVVWNYKEFVDVFNQALADAFTDLKTLEPLAPPTQPPFVEFDGKTRLCTFYAPEDYNTGGPLDVAPAPPTIHVYMNLNLYELFPSWNTLEETIAGELLYRFNVNFSGTNTITIGGNPFLAIEQEFSTLPLWNDFETIVFESGTIPVNPEYDPTDNNNAVTRTLVTDFLPPEQLNSRDQLQYVGVGWKRFVDLNSSFPLRDITVNALWVTTWGDRYPVYMGYNENFSMKLLFRKKLGLQLEEAYGSYDD
jgi:hypothetical protein